MKIIVTVLALVLVSAGLTGCKGEGHPISADCRADAACANRWAETRSRRDSVIVQVGRSDAFFEGRRCGDQCQAFAAGYRWAESVGLTRFEGCSEKSGRERDGCLAYFEDITEQEYESTDPRQ
jgi:hypothetical protein